jgi:hypothetical protein
MRPRSCAESSTTTRAGSGYARSRIALNADGAHAPAPRRAGRPRGWRRPPSAKFLYRSLYRGLIEWGRTKKRDQWGQKRYLDRPESRVESDARHPSSASSATSNGKAVHARLDGARQGVSARHGRPIVGAPRERNREQVLVDRVRHLRGVRRLAPRPHARLPSSAPRAVLCRSVYHLRGAPSAQTTSSWAWSRPTRL